MHEITLGSYKNLKLPEPNGLTELGMEKAVTDSVLNTISTWSKNNVPISNGDNVILKVEANENGLIVPELCQSKLEYTVGDRDMLKEFSSSVGKKNGEKFTIEIEFDENCPVERVRNKKVDFFTTITDVNHRELPYINDELIQKIVPDCKSVAELKDRYEEILKARNLENIKEQKKDIVLEVIIRNSTWTFDQNEFEDTLNTVVEQAKAMILNSNVPNIKQLMASTKNDPAFIQDCKVQTEKIILENLIINEIANIEDITISPEELEKQKSLYAYDVTSSEEFNKYFPTDQSFKLYLLKEKVLDWLCKCNF